MQPDEKVRKTEFIGTEYEYDSVVDVIPNPYTIEMSLTILVSSIMIFGFASIVEASETFLAQYRPEEEFEE